LPMAESVHRQQRQDPALQRADLERVCHQRHWEIVKVYEVEESAFGKRPRERFQAMLEDARKGKFDMLVAWSLDRFSREGEWSVSRIMVALQDWNVRFYSYNEPFLDTTGPFAGFLIPLFAWLARQESIRKGKAVKLGMEKASAKGKPIGRPVVVDKVDADLVARIRHQLSELWWPPGCASRAVGTPRYQHDPYLPPSV
jgi:DNA invertase Pin-like site-specific DNA recombinase